MSIFDAVTRAENPSAAVAALGVEEMVRLARELDAMPEVGMPGVVRALVTCEASRRWFAQYRVLTKESGC